MRLLPVSEVADMETRLGPAGRHGDPVFQHNRRVGFVRDLGKAGSVGFVEAGVEHVGLFFVAKNAGVQRFIFDARASNRHFLNPPSGPLLTGESLPVEFQGAREDAQKWFVGSADIETRVRVVGRVSERTRFKRSVPDPFVPGRERPVPSRQISFWNVQVRTRMRSGLSMGESRGLP